MEVEGYLEEAANGLVVGWARQVGNDQAALLVAVWIDEDPPIIVRADQFREDVRDAGRGTGHYGFAVRVPTRNRSWANARIAGTDIILAGSPVPLALGASLISRRPRRHVDLLANAALTAAVLLSSEIPR